jgi:acetolactate synthase-1/2/3 large subunit
VDRAEDAGRLAAEAWAESFGPEPGPVSLILPADSAWNPGGPDGVVAARPALRAPDPVRIAAAVAAVRAAAKPVILINGTACHAHGLRHAARLKAAGIRVLTDTFLTRQARGAGHFAPDRMQYFAEHALADLAGVDLMLLAGTGVPVAFFAYPGKPSVLVPEGCRTLSLGGRDHDSAGLLAALADALGLSEAAPAPVRAVPALPTGELNPGKVADSLARHIPEGALVSDDGVTGSLACFLATQNAAPHDWFMLTGGAIGQGMPLAVGLAIGGAERKTICLSGDGAGMYTLQALWTMARDGLDVTTIVFVNHSYRILNIELYRTGAGQPGPAARDMLGIGRPEIDWVSLAQGMGVPALACATGEAFDAALAEAMAGSGPRLIAAMVPG